MHPASFPIPLIITHIRDEVSQVKTFTLATASGEPLIYRAGQFLTFSFRLGTTEERRSYSVSSSPALQELLAITVKRVDNGAFSRWLIDAAKVGDTLVCTGIAGLFTLPDPADNQHILLFAAGIGITPMFSLIKEFIATTAGGSLTLIYSNRSPDEAVFIHELLELEQQSAGRLIIEWLYSNHKQLLRARLTRSVMDELMQKYLRNASTALAYICGPADYRWLVQLLLEETGIPAGQIRQEIFITERNTILQAPPDKTPHQVQLYYLGQVYTFTAQYPDTILMAAQKAGITLPYSCRAGRCSSCAAQCTKGKVWMAYNEVLTEKDQEHGLILTCTGYVVDGDVTIRL